MWKSSCSTTICWKSIFSVYCLCSPVKDSVQSLSHVRLFATPWTAAHQVFLSITNSRSLLNTCPSSWWCHPAISSSVIAFSSWLQSFPASESFQMGQLSASGGQGVEVSASTSEHQDWFPLGWTVGSPCSPRDSQATFPTPQFKSINSLVLSLLYSPTLISIHGKEPSLPT